MADPYNVTGTIGAGGSVPDIPRVQFDGDDLNFYPNPDPGNWVASFLISIDGINYVDYTLEARTNTVTITMPAHDVDIQVTWEPEVVERTINFTLKVTPGEDFPMESRLLGVVRGAHLASGMFAMAANLATDGEPVTVRSVDSRILGTNLEVMAAGTHDSQVVSISVGGVDIGLPEVGMKTVTLVVAELPAGDIDIIATVTSTRMFAAVPIDNLVSDLADSAIVDPWLPPDSVMPGTPGGAEPAPQITADEDVLTPIGEAFGGLDTISDSLLAGNDGNMGKIAVWATAAGAPVSATVSIDGSPVGYTPYVSDLLPAGSYSVEVQYGSDTLGVQTVTRAAEVVNAYETTIVGCRFSELTTEPATDDSQGELQVYTILNGQYVATPVTVDSVEVGESIYAALATASTMVTVCRPQGFRGWDLVCEQVSISPISWGGEGVGYSGEVSTGGGAITEPPKRSTSPQDAGLLIAQDDGFLIDWRDNDADQWSKGVSIPVTSTSANRIPVMHIHRMGRYRTRQYRIRHSGNFPMVVVTLEEDVQALEK
jgi:hypothetical protein